jgi:tRNA threonylcarbamoyladenosine biosynthesis protein TsaE
MEQTSVLVDAAATRRYGAELAEAMGCAAVLLLQGDLGAGKTSLVQGLAAALGIGEPITSPTFALAQHYRGSRGALVHLDLYRLDQAAAADELFDQEAEEAQALGAVLAVEWPERLSQPPQPCWRVRLELLDGSNPEAGRRAHLLKPPR